MKSRHRSHLPGICATVATLAGVASAAHRRSVVSPLRGRSVLACCCRSDGLAGLGVCAGN